MSDKDKPEPIALVDLDGTLADFTGAMREGLKQLEGPNEQWDYDNYEQADEPAYMHARRQMVKAQPGFWSGLKPLDLGFDILCVLQQFAFEITIFTKAPRRPVTAYTEKVLWCEQNLAAYAPYNISIVRDKGLHYGRILVDDWPPYIMRWLEHRPRAQVIMPAHPYNQAFNHPQVLRYTGDEMYSQLIATVADVRRQCRD